MKDIINDLCKHAGERPDAALYAFLDGAGQVRESYTYREFHERTNFVAAALEGTGKVGFGDRVLLVYPPGLDFIVAFVACVKLGAVPVPIAPPDASGFAGGVEKLAAIAGDAAARIALTSDPYLHQFKGLAGRSPGSAPWLDTQPLASLDWLPTDHLQGRSASFVGRRNPLLFLQHTSGSTQTPRGVMVSHDNVVHNCWSTLSHRPTGVSWLPHYHDMGLIGYYLFIMVTGGSMYGFSGAHFLKRPMLWLETITKYRGTITSAPNFAFEYCLREDKVPSHKLSSLDLSSMCCMMNASEPVRASTYDRFLEKFGRFGLSAKASVVFYGLAENTLSVTGGGRVQLTVNHHLIEQNHLRIEAPRPDRYNQLSLVSCGNPLPGIDVRIVDPQTRAALGEDLVGEVWVGGPSKAAGYWNKPGVNDELFHADLDGSITGSQTYLRTGDIGFLHDGELFICSRLKDLIIIGGRNYYPADIEAVVERASPKVRAGCVAAFGIDKGGDGEGIAVLAEAKRANDLPDLEDICREVRTRCQIEIDMLALVPHGTITKTSSGKIARQSCKARWHAGEVQLLASRRRTERPGTDTLITNLLSRFDIDGYEARTLAELGIDSLTLVDLSVHLEGLWKAQGASRHRHPAEALFDLRILQAITVGELRAFLTALSTRGAMPEIAPQLYAGRLAAIEREETQLMTRDAALPADVRPQSARMPPSGQVLLTGATGFLGSFLLEALLRLTDYEIVTLVRAEDADHAKARTEAALQRTGLFEDPNRRFGERVHAVAGDLARPQLGLSDDDWARLSQDLCGIYHCGAEVDYVKPYQTLRDANVSSTLDVIRLASERRPKVLHFASTTFTFGFVSRDTCWETDANAEMAGLNFGYSQTKWVAEQLVLQAIRRGLNARIYRPSLISASRQGRYVRRDLTARILSYMIRHGLSVDSANQISLLPVDVCANNLVALSLLDDPMPTTFHLTADHYYTMKTVCTVINEQAGYPFEYVSLDRFIDHMNAHCTKDDPLFPLVAFFNQNYRRIHQMRDKRYDSRQYRAERGRSLVTMAEPALGDTVGRIVAFLQGENLVPAPPAHRISAV